MVFFTAVRKAERWLDLWRRRVSFCLALFLAWAEFANGSLPSPKNLGADYDHLIAVCQQSLALKRI